MGLLNSAASSPANYPQYTGLQLQTSSGAVPISICYGANKIAPNVVWTGNFASHPVYSGGGKGGGKGGIFGGGTASGYDYTAAVILGLCEGPIAGVGTVWNGQSLTNIATGASKSTSFNALTLFNGTTPQSAWGYLTTRFPAQALGYNGLAYAASADYDLGSGATVDALSFEAYGLLVSSAAVNGYDADPALIIQDFLTNAQFGVGFPAASIDATTLLGSSGDASYQTYCRATGLALSPALTDQESASSILSRWLQLTNTAAVWSSGLLKFIPYGDAAVTGALYSGTPGAAVPGASAGTPGPGTSFSGGSCTFNPDLTPIYNLGDDDYVYQDGRDPVNIERSDPYAAYNMQILEIFQRSNYYDATPITAFDQNAIELYGLRIASTVTAHEICDPLVAQTAAQLILQRGLYIRNHYGFKLSWEYGLLEPMDLVTLTDTNLGLQDVAVRIIEIEEDENGLLNVMAEEFPGGTATAVAYPVQSNVNVLPFNRTIVPAQVNTPIIFEPPVSLAGATPQIWIALSGGSGGVADPNWGGANIWVSLDNASYIAIGQVSAPARQGVLTASLAAFTGLNPDSTDILSVNLAESGGTLTSTTAAGATQAVTLMIVDNEFLAFETATLAGANAYQLGGLYRGLYGSAASAHTAGALCARLDGAIFRYDLPSSYIGQPLYLKFQGFNVFGGGLQDLSTCTAYSFSPAGTGLADPIATQLLSGLPTDLGQASDAVAIGDDFGTIGAGAVVGTVDLGIL